MAGPVSDLASGVHPRVAIDRDELISLVEQVKGDGAGPLIERIQGAPALDEPDGDSL